jgi:hypothetical protein
MNPQTWTAHCSKINVLGNDRRAMMSFAGLDEPACGAGRSSEKSPGRGRPGLHLPVGVPVRQAQCIVGGHNDARDILQQLCPGCKSYLIP